MSTSVTQKIILVTGANIGLGFSIVKALLQSPSSASYRVFLAGRSIEKVNTAVETLKKEIGEGSKSEVEGIQLDLTDDGSIERAYEVLKGVGRLDALVNNAGATFDLEYLAGKISLRESFNKAYDVNVSGTNVVTHTMMPLLFKSNDPRLIFITGLSSMNQASKAYFPTPPQPAGWPKPPLSFETIGYRATKCALNMLFLDWNHKLKEDNIKVWNIAPGIMQTNLGGVPEMAKKLGGLDPMISGRFVVDVLEGGRDQDAGKMIKRDGLFEL